MKIGSPLYLVEAHTGCWNCAALQRVIKLATPRVDAREDEEDEELNTMDAAPEDELILLSYLKELPVPLNKWFIDNEPNFRIHSSQSIGESYYANLCDQCGVNFGDFYLHEVDGPYFPMRPEDAVSMVLVKLPFEGIYEVDSEYSYGSGDLIAQYAKRK